MFRVFFCFLVIEYSSWLEARFEKMNDPMSDILFQGIRNVPISEQKLLVRNSQNCQSNFAAKMNASTFFLSAKQNQMLCFDVTKTEVAK
jgi:hypothetical protein